MAGYSDATIWLVIGVLGIGSKETLQFTPHEKDYEQLGVGSKLYRRIR